MEFLFCNTRTLIIALFILAFNTIASNQAVAAEKKLHSIVFHVNENDPAKWNKILSIVHNVQQEMGPESVEAEIVVHGDGLYMVKAESEVANRLTEAQKEGVVLAACAVTLKRQHLTEQDLQPGVKIVPIGVVEVIRKQEAGWSYVKL